MKEAFAAMLDFILFGVCIFLLAGSIYLTVKSRFVQFRSIPILWKKLQPSSDHRSELISPYKALFTAMSTTLGISTLVGPVIAIQLGGPGAILGFLLASFFGSAATYTEVSLVVHYRNSSKQEKVVGGPMQYLKQIFSPSVASWYATCCMILMMGWSAAQSNQLAAALASPALGSFQIPAAYSGAIIVLLVMLTLRGGTKRVSSFSAKIVPLMFLLYIGSSLWIIGCNIDKLGTILGDLCAAAIKPYALANGAIVGGVISALRWGIFKGVQVTEAGVGTQTIPHSFAATQDAHSQGTLAMVSTFSAGGLAFLSGCVALITNTWQDPSLPLGVGMVIASYQQYFSTIGVAIVALCSILFGFGTILGNSFNGGQCYEYLFQNKRKTYYLIGTAIMIFLGAIGEVKTVWSMVDVALAFMVIPHMSALLVSMHKFPKIFALQKNA
jgi:alanine or glycine:cation symporter, AGCS family